jgi:hypothetical protein
MEVYGRKEVSFEGRLTESDLRECLVMEGKFITKFNHPLKDLRYMITLLGLQWIELKSVVFKEYAQIDRTAWEIGDF